MRAVVLAALLALAATPALRAHAAAAPGDAAAPVASATPPATAKTAAEEWEGRYCTPLGCGPGAPASAGTLAAFAAAALGALFWARRGRRRA